MPRFVTLLAVGCKRTKQGFLLFDKFVDNYSAINATPQAQRPPETLTIKSLQNVTPAGVSPAAIYTLSADMFMEKILLPEEY